MRKLLIFLLITFSIQFTLGQTGPDRALILKKFVPKNWKLLLSQTGDLNGDSFDDVALFIEQVDEKNYRYNEGLGQSNLNLNPRHLLILFGNQAGEYILATKNINAFIPSENDSESTCLQDPVSETGGIEIKKGLLIVKFQYWLSCGSWYTTNVSYTFRYQKNEFELIGFDSFSFHRSTGEEENVSINFSTSKKIITTGGNIFEEEKNKPTDKTSRIRFKPLLKLSDCDSSTFEKMQEI